MVSPITGPFTRAFSEISKLGSNFATTTREVSRTWYRQRRPYNLPLTFTYQEKRVTYFATYNPGGFYATTSDCPAYPDQSTATWYAAGYNKAYARFISQVRPDSAGMAINYVQRQQAISMIAARATQIATFAKALKKGNIPAAARALGVSVPPKGSSYVRRGSKNFGNAFLEWHFGWSPLVGDIYSAVNVLQGGVPPVHITSSHKDNASSSSSWEIPPYAKRTSTVDQQNVWRIGARIYVSNPNLFLANQLGLVNPAVVAYDAVPFSFVLNWFVNVEQFLSSFTDLWGITLQDTYVSCYTMTKSTLREDQRSGTSQPWFFVKEYRGYTTKTTRRPGSIPGPTLVFKGSWALSPIRGLTAVSLLVQRLKP